jgi:predicted PurR-regulated permease PerM
VTPARRNITLHPIGAMAFQSRIRFNRPDVRIPRHHHRQGAKQDEPEPEPDDGSVDISPSELARMFAPPPWLRDLGLLAWFLVGVGFVLVGTIWIFDEISTILVPVIVGTIAASVAGPLVDALQRRRVPRAAGAALVLLMLLALGVVVLLLVLGGIVEQGDQIRTYATQALDKAEAWVNDAGADGTSGTKNDVSTGVQNAGSTLIHGLASGIEGLTSLVFFISFALFSTFFLLKDFTSIRGFVETHLGIPAPVAHTVTENVFSSLRRYFLGLTIVAAFNGTVVGLGALALGVPLAGTIAVVTFVTAYVPFIGAVVSGAFAVIIALAAEGTGTAAAMLLIVLLANGLLQNVFQPIAFGATLGLNPLAVLVVTIAAGSLFGMIGLILAAPLTSAAVHISRDLAAARAALASETPAAPPVPAASS